VGLVGPSRETLAAMARGLERLGYRVVYEAAPAPAEAAGAAERLARLGAEVVVLPGSWGGPWARLSESLGVRVVRGAWSPSLTLAIVARWGVSRLSPEVEAEKAVGPDMARLAVETLSELRAEPPGGAAFNLGGLRVPLRPPPLLVVSEVYPRSCDWEELTGEVYWRALEGADVVSLGWDGRVPLDCYWRLLARLLDSWPAPVAADPGSPRLAVEAARRGAPLALSLTVETLGLVPPSLRRAAAFVVLAPGGLLRASEEARRLGFERAILDPVLRPAGAPGALGALCLARSESGAAGYPLMVGLNNVVELMDGDTTGSTLLGAVLAAEAGASLVMVGEESFKARGNTWEARVAAGMASLSLYWGRPPKDLGLDLLLFKRKRGPVGEVGGRGGEG